MSKYGLFFGEFNPFTVAHLVLPHYMMQKFKLDKVVFVPTPPVALKGNSSAIDNYRAVIHQMWWKAGIDYRYSALSKYDGYDLNNSHLKNIRDLMDRYNGKIKRKRKYTYLCGVNHAIRLANDPDWNDIKKDVNVQVMYNRSNRQQLNSMCNMDPDYFSGRFNIVPYFDNQDSQILDLLHKKQYDDMYLQENLNPGYSK